MKRALRFNSDSLVRCTVTDQMVDVYRCNSSIEEAPLGDELMLYDPDKSQFYVLNATMSHVWRYCDGGKSADSIVESVRETFSDSDMYPVATEIDAALGELLALGVVTKD